MRKITTTFLIGLAIIGLAGCSLIGPSSRELRQDAYNMSQNAVEAVIKEDAGALESLFCQNTSDARKIGDFLSEIDGNFTKYDNVTEVNLPVHFISDSEDYAIYRSEYSNSDYTVRIVSCARSVFDKNDEGVQYISFYKGDSLVASAGCVIERYKANQVPGKKTDVNLNQLDSQDAQRKYDLNVLYYLNQKDKDGFVSLFSAAMKDEAEDRFNDVLDFMGSGINTYSVIEAPGGGSEWEKDHWNYMEAQTSIYDIVTSDEDVFEIRMNTVFVDDGHPSNEGITYFEIRKVEHGVNGLLEHDVIECLVIGED